MSDTTVVEDLPPLIVPEDNADGDQAKAPNDSLVVEDPSSDELLYLLAAIQLAERHRQKFQEFLEATPFNIAYIGVKITEVLTNMGPRRNHAKFQAEKLKEITGLQERKVWKFIPKTEVPKDSSICGGRFVLALKKFGTRDGTENVPNTVQR